MHNQPKPKSNLHVYFMSLYSVLLCPVSAKAITKTDSTASPTELCRGLGDCRLSSWSPDWGTPRGLRDKAWRYRWAAVRLWAVDAKTDMLWRKERNSVEEKAKPGRWKGKLTEGDRLHAGRDVLCQGAKTLNPYATLINIPDSYRNASSGLMQNHFLSLDLHNISVISKPTWPLKLTSNIAKSTVFTAK